MDTDPHQPTPSAAHPATHEMQDDGAGKVSAIIGSDAFVERVLRATALGAGQAIAENVALEHRPAKP